MEFNRPPEWGARFQFPENIQVEYNGFMGSLTSKIAVKMAERYDDAVVEQIAMEARAEGVSDCTVLNKVAILEALKRRTPMKPRDDGWLYCPVCGKDVLLDHVRFCPGCGQALDWGKDDD